MADPVAEVVRMTRAALAAAGFERRQLDGTVYFAGGSGKPLVLVHGVNDQAGTWALVAPSLARTHRVVIVDLPGHGESAPHEGPIAMPFVVDRLHAVIRDAFDSPSPGSCGATLSRSRERADARSAAGEGLPKVTLVGNSMGAWAAILYALQYGQHVDQLILESGGGLDLPLSVPLTASNRDEAWTILRAVHGPNAPLPEWAVDALLARATNAPLLRMTGLEYVDERLEELRLPTTIVWGEHDGVVSRAYVETLRARIAGARLEVIEGAAHIPHAQQPERFLACLTATF